jgi:hypothetical protein
LKPLGPLEPNVAEIFIRWYMYFTKFELLVLMGNSTVSCYSEKNEEVINNPGIFSFQ